MLDRPIDFDHWDLHQDVLGIDEAGRGPIAGPLVVAGVCFEKGFTNEMIDDSKKLTEKKREALFSLITNEALWYQILVIEEKIIDKKNIYRTTQEAMLEIAHNAPVDIVLSDAMPFTIAGQRMGIGYKRRSKVFIDCSCQHLSKSYTRSIYEKAG